MVRTLDPMERVTYVELAHECWEIAQALWETVPLSHYSSPNFIILSSHCGVWPQYCLAEL